MPSSPEECSFARYKSQKENDAGIIEKAIEDVVIPKETVIKIAAPQVVKLSTPVTIKKLESEVKSAPDENKAAARENNEQKFKELLESVKSLYNGKNSAGGRSHNMVSKTIANDTSMVRCFERENEEDYSLNNRN